MKFAQPPEKELPFLDMVAEPEDLIHVEKQFSVHDKSLLVLYVHVNGRTVMRIGSITVKNLLGEEYLK